MKMGRVEELLGQVDVARVVDETVELLREYLTFDTTNPPGDVSKVAAWLEERLRSGGLDPVRLEASPDKPNLVATIPGSLEPLILSHHMDVVAAPAEGWSVEPFGGLVKDGHVYGRGTLDMKGYGAMTIACAFALRRLGVPLRRGLRLLITADEEVGGIWGARWLAEHHPQAVRGAYMLTEGTFARPTRRGVWYLVEVAQKGVSTVRLVARGKPGHASAPTDDNAVVRMSSALARLGAYRSPPAGGDLARQVLKAFPRDFLNVDRDVDELDDDEVETVVQEVFASRRRTTLLRNTYTPTMVNAGVGQNVIPAVCEAFVDCRSLPGVSTAQVVAELTDAIDDPEIEIELVKSSEGSSSPPEGELLDAISAAVATERPDALVIPYLTSGGTDAKHIRPLGVACYGLIPFELSETEVNRIHGIDERVSLDNIDLGTRILLRIMVHVCAGG